jgi:hypothetical protein
VYEEALQSEQCEAVHLTRVLRDDVQCDTFLPPLDPKVGVAPQSPSPPCVAKSLLRFPRTARRAATAAYLLREARGGRR